MLWRSAVLGLVIALTIALPAGSAAPTLREAALCRQTPDQAVCLLRLSARSMDGEVWLNHDSDLSWHNPDLLMAGGVKATPSQLDLALSQALKAYRNGKPAPIALAAIEGLPDPEPAPMGPERPFSTGGSYRPRLLAYGWLWNELGDAQQGELARAALAGWERELTDDPHHVLETHGVEALMKAYMRADDFAAARRVMSMDGRTDSATVLRRLSIIGDMDAAAIALQGASLKSVEAAVQSELFPWPLTENSPVLPGISTKAMEQLNSARLDLFRVADAKGRTELAHQAADAYLAADGSIRLGRADLLRLLHVASPGVATAWLEQQEHRLEQAGPNVLNGFNPRLYSILTGWSAMGRVDRVERLLGRWTPLAVKGADIEPSGLARSNEVSPQLARFLLDEGRLAEARGVVDRTPQLLIYDIEAGRGLSNLAAYSDADPDALAAACLIATYRGTDLDSGERCMMDGLSKSPDDKRRLFYAELGVNLAASAAVAGEWERARSLWNLAASAVLPLEEARAEPVRGGSLRWIAKAMLQADGRLNLPPRSKP